MAIQLSVPADTILQVDHLTMRFGGLVAIGDVSFSAKRGEITALIGPNGAGKTTVFNCITGFYKPTEGMITLRSKDGTEYLLERLPGHDVNRKARVARTFQNIRLFSGMTVLENLLVAQHTKLMKASGYTVLGLLGIGGYRAASNESIELAKHWLAKADLTQRADEPAGSLPYGDQRRLEIARAMCTEPELLCLDEPAAGLNPRESLALNTMLNDIKSTGTSILLIEHDMSVVMQISDHVVVLEYGRKISDGDPTFVKNDPRVIAAYLGVEDEEVEDVLVQVGDEHVIEQLDAEPDPAHGPGSSSSLMAGPFSDTILHSDPGGEVMRVSAAASKAAYVERMESRKAADAARKPTAKRSGAGATSAKAKAPAAKTEPKPAKATKPTPKPSKSKPTSKAEAVTGSTQSEPVYGLTRTVKPKPPSKPATSKATASKSNATTAAKSKPAAAKPAASKATAAKPKATTAKPSVTATASSKPITAKKSAPKPATSKAAASKSSAATAARSKPTAPKVSAPKPAVAKKPAPSAAKSGRAISNRLRAPRGGVADDLLLIKGIGPINKRKLNEHGIFHFDQIAAWTRADIVAAEAYLEFDGRIAREDWIGQAKLLAAAVEKKLGKGGGSK